MSKKASVFQTGFMAWKYRSKQKLHDSDAPWDGYEESDDTEQNACFVRINRQKWIR